MNYLNKDLSQITSEDIVKFCEQKYPEGFNLDYKKEASAKGIAKHFAAFSNSRGGDIIIGVEEDPNTGLPIKWEGVKNSGKIIESINQSASMVKPLPSYDYRVTDTLSNGNVFIIIRILEGDATPYYVYNDNNIYIRSHNITKLIDLAAPDYVKLLFDKTRKAEMARKNSTSFVRKSFAKAKEMSEKERLINLAKGERVAEDKIGTKAADLEIILQPYYPLETSVVKMKNFAELVKQAGVRRVLENPNPFPKGLYRHDYDLLSGEYTYVVAQANGLFYWAEDILRVEDEVKHIQTSWILNRVLKSLQYIKHIYEGIGYVGIISGNITLALPDDVLLHDISSESFFWPRDPKNSFLNKYEWNFELDTNMLSNVELRNEYVMHLTKQIEWDLGFDSGNKDEMINQAIAEIQKYN